MFKKHTVCRACGFGKPEIPTLKHSLAAGIPEEPQSLIPVMDLGLQPLANDFRGSTDWRTGYYPLSVLFCPRCTLAQLSVVVSPETLYSNYPYVTSPSATMREHFESIVDDIMFEIGERRGAIEIGSNDGLLLDYMRRRGFGPLLGIEPAGNLARLATEQRNITTINSFFSKKAALDAESINPIPAVIIARHVFCHIDNWREFIDNLAILSDKETLICIEVPYAVDQLRAGSWDQCYAEHLSYLTVKAMAYLIAASPFRLHRVIHYPIHGGAIMLMLRAKNSGILPHPSVGKAVVNENVTSDDWQLLNNAASRSIFTLRSLVDGFRVKGQKVVGYGASAKSTVWLNACKFDRRDISFVCDNTPQKLWTEIPGTNIPVVDEGALTREYPDYAVLFAWNFADEIIAKEKKFKEHGGKWIIPVPEVRVM